MKNNYRKYYALAHNINEDWAIFFSNHIEQLCDLYEIVYSNYLQLSDQRCYVHGDYNRLNILWNKEHPYIIDWETATVGNPTIDSFNSAWFMSDDVDEEKYKNYIETYFSIFTLNDDLNTSIYAALIEECNWLEFSLRRALGIHSQNEEEVKMGKDSVLSSLTEIMNYYEKISLMLKIIELCKTRID